MSGSGRKSQYRKSVTTTFLDDSRIPEPAEKVVVVLGNRGDNTFEIRTEAGERALARLPKKFNKLIWIKTGDHLIIEDDRLAEAKVEEGQPAPVENAPQFTIKHILSKPNVKYLKSKNMWPANLDNVDGGVEATATSVKAVSGRDESVMPYQEEEEYEDGEYEDEEEILLDSKGNTIEK